MKGEALVKLQRSLNDMLGSLTLLKYFIQGNNLIIFQIDLWQQYRKCIKMGESEDRDCN